MNTNKMLYFMFLLIFLLFSQRVVADVLKITTTITNDITTPEGGKIIVNVGQPMPDFIDAFWTDYIWSDILAYGQTLHVVAQTKPGKAVGLHRESVWRYHIYYIPPGASKSYHLAAIKGVIAGESLAQEVENFNSWLTVKKARKNNYSVSFTLSGTPPT